MSNQYQNETKNCQNCKNDFTIEPDDFSFYEKIKVPPPTFCPECRMVRRLLSRNERTLYKSNCDLCAKSMISVYRDKSRSKVYCNDCYYGDGWNPMDYGMDYDLNKNFFLTLRELFKQTAHPSLDIRNCENSQFNNFIFNSKDCYLSFGVSNCEQAYYSTQVHYSKNVFDCDISLKSDSSYDSVNIFECYRTYYSVYATSCMDSYFLYDCSGCSNCFGCTNLRNKQYHIYNKPHTKEEYEKFMSSLNLGSSSFLEKIKKEVIVFMSTNPVRFAHIKHSVDCTGDNIEGSKNCKASFGTREGVEDCKYVAIAGYNLKDSYDIYGGGLKSELGYECVSFTGNSRIKFSKQVRESTDSMYSEFCMNCNHIFGCSGLRNKSYCIFNKQYTKEEYEEIIPKLVEFSKSNPYIVNGRKYSFGEFFLPEDFGFAYNESVAQEFFPLTKDQILEKGYSWVEEKEKNYIPTMNWLDIPDSIKDVPDSIIKEVIICKHKTDCVHKCTQAYRITQTELDFYKQHQISIPVLCPNCRYFERLSKRSELKLYTRQCMCGEAESPKPTRDHGHKGKCEVEFETSYAPDRPEIVYCEKCYQQEIY